MNELIERKPFWTMVQLFSAKHAFLLLPFFLVVVAIAAWQTTANWTWISLEWEYLLSFSPNLEPLGWIYLRGIACLIVIALAFVAFRMFLESHLYDLNALDNLVRYAFYLSVILECAFVAWRLASFTYEAYLTFQESVPLITQQISSMLKTHWTVWGSWIAVILFIIVYIRGFYTQAIENLNKSSGDY